MINVDLKSFPKPKILATPLFSTFLPGHDVLSQHAPDTDKADDIRCRQDHQKCLRQMSTSLTEKRTFQRRKTVTLRSQVDLA